MCDAWIVVSSGIIMTALTYSFKRHYQWIFKPIGGLLLPVERSFVLQLCFGAKAMFIDSMILLTLKVNWINVPLTGLLPIMEQMYALTTENQCRPSHSLNIVGHNSHYWHNKYWDHGTKEDQFGYKASSKIQKKLHEVFTFHNCVILRGQPQKIDKNCFLMSTNEPSFSVVFFFCLRSILTIRGSHHFKQ